MWEPLNRSRTGCFRLERGAGAEEKAYDGQESALSLNIFLHHYEDPLLSKFAKYHGHGNDFIIIADLAPAMSIVKLQNQAPQLCDRHKGIGADGIVVLVPKPGYLDMTVINADGSLAQNCGNGLRCAARWYFENYNASEITINLGEKAYFCASLGEDISVTMGECEVEALGLLKWAGLSVKAFKALIGNRHLVFLSAEQACSDMEVYLHEAQKSFADFKEYNIGFVFARRGVFESFVFERGVGWTKSCGSGACAAACAIAFESHVFSGEFTLCQPGGDIKVSTRVLQSHDRLASFYVSQVGGAVGVYYGNLCP